MYRMFLLVGNFVSSLIWTLKSKKPIKNLKNLKTCSKKPRFFPAVVCLSVILCIVAVRVGVYRAKSCQRVPIAG